MPENTTPAGKKLVIKRVNPNGLRPVFVNDVIITHTKGEFFMTISQIEVPAFLSEEETAGLESIDAVAVGKFVLTPKFFKVLQEALKTNYEKYLKSIEEEGEE